MAKKVRVLIVDDSASVRQTLSEILSSDDGIEVIGTAGDRLPPPPACSMTCPT
jgi:two-component system chemotaxis response regulator CheB